MMQSSAGLLASDILGGPSAPADEEKPTIALHIPMNGETNKFINFTRLAEEKYGFDALNPRAAAQRARKKKISAMSDAIEKKGQGSGDEMNIDGTDSESEPEEATQPQLQPGQIGPDGKKVRRRRKADDYDKDDPFVDDTELLWENEAAASKDGFFVYSGPLVPQGEKATIERADGTVKRGRGRGRGRGSRGGRGRASAGATAAAADGTTSDAPPAKEPSTRGRGTTARKPRITKADRAQMEQEKQERERLAMLTSRSNQAGNAGAEKPVEGFFAPP